jgi:PAS domain S-box-containing protein
MSERVDPELVTAASLRRLTQGVGRVQAATTIDEGLALLAAAAAELVDARRATAGPGAPREPGSDGAALALVSGAGEDFGLLVVEARGAAFTPTERALLAELARLGVWALENIHLRQRLLEQDERLRLALEAASLGTWEHVPATHATYWDARSKAIFGRSPDDPFEFEQYMGALHPDDVERVFAGISKAMDPAGSGECSLEYRIRMPDGVERWVEAHGRCAFVDGVPLRINGTLLDITTRRQAEEAIHEAARRKDQFLAVLGHELRNPLAPILTALELMRLAHPGHAVREREVIDRQVRHMVRLVDDLLDLARIARGTITLRREPMDLLTAVERAVEIASPLFESRRHRLELEVPAGLWVDIDSVRFSQVVSNLLTNAAKFTEPGGLVRVSALSDGSEVSLAIQDNGMGIESHQVEAIFEPFVQATRRTEQALGGLGLGLALVRDLVQLHGGRVEVESAGLGRGSCFTLRLPLTSPAAPASAQAVERRVPELPGLRVLIVDDNEVSAEMLGLLLAELGHVVRVAHDGPRALAVAAELEPDVAVLDIGLPVMDGYELAARLREAHGARGLRLVALTGFGQDQDLERSRNAGFHHHLVKPIDTDDLQAALVDPAVL